MSGIPLPPSVYVTVSDAQRRVLDEAAAAVRARPNEAYYDPAHQDEALAGVRSGSAGALDALLSGVEERLARDPWLAVVRGLSPEASPQLLVALNRGLGRLISGPLKKPRAQLLHMIQTTTDLQGPTKPYSEHLHTDGADWIDPPERMSLFCVRPDRTGGGRTIMYTLEQLRAALDPSPELHAALREEPVAWKLAASEPGDVHQAPILTADRLRWRHYTMDAGYALLGRKPAGALARAISEVHRVIANPPDRLEVALRAGDWIVSQNLRSVHGRTPVAAAERTRRLMVRSWIRHPAG